MRTEKAFCTEKGPRRVKTDGGGWLGGAGRGANPRGSRRDATLREPRQYR